MGAEDTRDASHFLSDFINLYKDHDHESLISEFPTYVDNSDVRYTIENEVNIGRDNYHLPSKIWKKIQQRFVTNGKDIKTYIKELEWGLTCMKQKDIETCATYHLRLTTERNRIASLEKKNGLKNGGLTENTIIRMFLQGLYTTDENKQLRAHLEREVNRDHRITFAKLKGVMEQWFTSEIRDIAPSKMQNSIQGRK